MGCAGPVGPVGYYCLYHWHKTCDWATASKRFLHVMLWYFVISLNMIWCRRAVCLLAERTQRATCAIEIIISWNILTYIATSFILIPVSCMHAHLLCRGRAACNRRGGLLCKQVSICGCSAGGLQWYTCYPRGMEAAVQPTRCSGQRC